MPVYRAKSVRLTKGDFVSYITILFDKGIGVIFIYQISYCSRRMGCIYYLQSTLEGLEVELVVGDGHGRRVTHYINPVGLTAGHFVGYANGVDGRDGLARRRARDREQARHAVGAARPEERRVGRRRRADAVPLDHLLQIWLENVTQIGAYIPIFKSRMKFYSNIGKKIARRGDRAKKRRDRILVRKQGICLQSRMIM